MAVPVVRSPGQGWHWALEVALLSGPKVSAGQDLQNLEPLPSWYVPAGHPEHVPLELPNLPRSHWRQLAAPGLLVAPCGHLLHLSWS